MRLRYLIADVAVIATAGASQLSGVAVPDDAAEPQSLEAVSQPDSGEIVDRVANLIWSYGDVGPLAGVRVDADEMTVDFWWKGDLSAGLQERLEDAPPSVAVSVHEAAFTLAEMEAAGDKAFVAGREGSIPSVARVALRTDGSAIEVGFESGSIGTTGSDRRHAVQAAVSALSRVPVTVVEREEPQVTSRRNDFDPWFGGGALAFSTAGVMDCSTAFAVLAPGGIGRLLTSSHCLPPVDPKWYDGAGDLLSQGGADLRVRHSLDSALIDPVGGTNGYVYGGPYDAGTSHPRYKLAVSGAGAPSTNGVVCASGANSGEHCQIDIVGQVLVSCPQAVDGTCLAWKANGRNGSVTNVGGDSGGPVYHDWGTGTVGARGVVNSGAGFVSCPATADPPLGKCFKQVFFIGVMDILNYWGVSIEVQ